MKASQVANPLQQQGVDHKNKQAQRDHQNGSERKIITGRTTALSSPSSRVAMIKPVKLSA